MFKDSWNYSSWLYLKTDLFPLTLLAPLGTLYWDRLPTPDFGALSAPSLNIATGVQCHFLLIVIQFSKKHLLKRLYFLHWIFLASLLNMNWQYILGVHFWILYSVPLFNVSRITQNRNFLMFSVIIIRKEGSEIKSTWKVKVGDSTQSTPVWKSHEHFLVRWLGKVWSHRIHH